MNISKLNDQNFAGWARLALGVTLIGFAVSGCDGPTLSNSPPLPPGDDAVQAPGAHVRTHGGATVDVNPPGGGVHVDVPPGAGGPGERVDVGPGGVRVAPQ